MSCLEPLEIFFLLQLQDIFDIIDISQRRKIIEFCYLPDGKGEIFEGLKIARMVKRIDHI